jgi:hypothetical protein
MFSKVKALRKKVASFNQTKVMREIMNSDSIKAQVIDLNQYQLYELGLQADGSPTGQYARITKEYYKPIAAAEGRDGRTDHITGKDTGALYRSMKVVAEADGISVAANDPNDFLKEDEPRALGLIPESRRQLLPEIRERFLEKFKETLKK